MSSDNEGCTTHYACECVLARLRRTVEENWKLRKELADTRDRVWELEAVLYEQWDLWEQVSNLIEEALSCITSSLSADVKGERSSGDNRTKKT